jgi:hypothetical protein
MSNWDFVLSYDHEAASWLSAQRLPHPQPRPGNRLPRTKEVIAARKSFDPAQLLLIDDFTWADDEYIPSGHFKVKGDLLVELHVLVRLSQACGQLWMYPDTGQPAIVVEAALDPELTYKVYRECANEENSWEHFHQKMYGMDAKSKG